MHDGAETRLRCVTCVAPICPKCLVETKVGFKCPEHGRVTAAPVRGAGGDTRNGSGKGGPGKGSGRPPARRGRVRIWPLFLVILLFPLFGLGMMALFAATAESDGFVRVLPLVAVGAVLFGAAFWFASKVAR